MWGGFRVEKKTIFVVDDADTTLSILEKELEDFYSVVAVNSIKKMFETIANIKPDLILLDYYMPEITFHEAMKRLKSDDRYREIPVIAISGSNYPDILDEVFAVGAVDFINKSIPSEDLLAKVGKCIK